MMTMIMMMMMMMMMMMVVDRGGGGDDDDDDDDGGVGGGDDDYKKHYCNLYNLCSQYKAKLDAYGSKQVVVKLSQYTFVSLLVGCNQYARKPQQSSMGFTEIQYRHLMLEEHE